MESTTTQFRIIKLPRVSLHTTELVLMHCYVMSYLEMCRSQRCFTKIMSLPLNQVGEEEGNFFSDVNNCKVSDICGTSLKMIYFVAVRLLNRWSSQYLF